MSSNYTERFWEKVDKIGCCRLWIGCKDSNGYEFTPENTYTWNRQRACRTCNRNFKQRERNYKNE